MKKNIIIILLFFLFSFNSQAQWLRMNAPAGGYTTAITKSNERIYVGTALGELYYSEINESGKYKWELMSLLTNECINDIIQIDDKIFVGTRNGLYISDNNGKDWVLEKFGHKYINPKKFKYHNKILYFVATKTIFLTKDNGVIWDSVSAPNMATLSSMDIRNDTIIVTSRFGTGEKVTEGKCIWISYDAGDNWLNITTDDIPFKQINSELILGDTIFIATTYGMFKSSLKYIKWEEVMGLDKADYKDIQYDGNNLYTVTSDGFFFYSKNNGLNWTFPYPQTIKPSDNYFPSRILIHNKDIILITYHSLLKTSDMGMFWYEANDGLISLNFLDIEVKDSEMLLASVKRGVFSSKDNGFYWWDYNNGLSRSQRYVNSICRTDDAIYSGAYIHGFLKKSVNGQSWKVLSNQLPQAHYYFIKEYKDYLFTATTNRNIGFYRVTKDGSSVDTLSYSDSTKMYINDFTSGEQGIYISSFIDGVLLSEDDGITWSSISENLQDSSFNSVAYSDGTLYAGSSTGKLYATKDLGVNWEIIYHTPVDTASITKIKVKDDKIFFATRVNGMVMTEDCGIKLLTTDGKKIGNISNNIRHKWIYDIEFFAEDSIIVSTAKGLYKAAISDFEYVSVEDEKLIGNYLYNYPPYPLPAKEKVSTLLYWDTKLDINNAEMAVYNSSGAKICGKERISLSPNSNWSGIVTWDASGVLPGIYFLQIKHGTRTKSIKMLIE